MKLLVSITFLVFLTSFQPKRQIPIILAEYPLVTLWPDNNMTIKHIPYNYPLEDGFLKINLANIKGEMQIQRFRGDSSLIEKGSYINSLSILRKYVVRMSFTGNGYISVLEYYQPLRNGKWYTYDSSGKVQDSSFYIKGIKSNL